MVDPLLLRNRLDDVVKALAPRSFEFDAEEFRVLEETRCEFQVETEELQAECNARSRAIGQR